MLNQNQVQTPEEEKLWDEVNNPPEKTYDLFGQLVDMNIFKGGYQKGTRGAVPFDPAIHQKAMVIVRFYIQPLPEINVKYVDQLTYESPNWADWGKVTFPSIKAQGIDDAREVNNRWFRFARVPNGKKYDKKDVQGNPTGEQGDEMTWKIVALFSDEDACRAAYIATGGQVSGNGRNVPTPAATSENTEMTTAYAFLKVIVANAARGKTTWAEAKEAVAQSLTQYPTVTQFYTVDSIETGKLITETTQLLPF